MGGRVDPALDIMNWLIANNVKATIFPTGSMVQNQNTDAGRQVLALVAANPRLFELGNHSYSHPDFTTITDAQIREELARTEAAVAAYTTLSMRPRFRPPFGAYDARVLSAVGAAGYAQTLMWDVDTIDWRPEADGGPTAASMAAKVVSNAQGGTIVLMHLGGYNTLDALPAMVQGLRDRGFQFVRISELPLD
jgi:peptidoglycan/xylan/chitin deacetylase (PgdA/CDA1 family)